MKKLILIFAFVFVATIMADAIISTELQEKMNEVGRSEESLPIIVLFKDATTLSEVSQQSRGESSISDAIQLLKEKAQMEHAWLQELSSNTRSDHNFRSIWLTNAVAMNADSAMIEQIAQQDNVAEVLYDSVVPMLQEAELTWGVEKIQANKVWNNYTGKGVTVAVIDTGVNEHNDLAGRVIDGTNYINKGQAPRDDNKHGTHCAGTIAGNGTSGKATGVAPEATIYAIKVLGANGSGQWSNLWEALEECIDNPHNIKVISMSLGGKANDSIRERLAVACKSVMDAGIIPVIAAGNSGSGASTIGTPGDVKDVITVGATMPSDKIAYFSSRGPVKWGTETYVKPDVCAPGTGIYSCSHSNPEKYISLDGTSMATPHVAGTVALMVQANPALNTAQAKDILEKTATDLGTAGKDNTYGSGRINVVDAVNASQSLMNCDESNARFEMVVKELSFETDIDSNGNIFITDCVENDVMPATVTIWVQVREKEAQKGIYHVEFKLEDPNGQTESGERMADFSNIPTDPNLFNPKYGFSVGNFEMLKGKYVGTVRSLSPNPQVKNLHVHLDGKATWPPRK